MADNRKSYNAVLRALQRAHGLNQAQARVAWRNLKERLDKTPRVADLKKHPRITSQEVKHAPARERALRAAKTRAEKRAAKKAAPPPPAPPKAAPPAKTTRGGRGRRISPPTPSGGGGGGAGAAPPIAPSREYEYPPEFDEIDDFFGGEEFAEEDEY